MELQVSFRNLKPASISVNVQRSRLPTSLRRRSMVLPSNAPSLRPCSGHMVHIFHAKSGSNCLTPQVDVSRQVRKLLQIWESCSMVASLLPGCGWASGGSVHTLGIGRGLGSKSGCPGQDAPRHSLLNVSALLTVVEHPTFRK